VYRLVDHTGAGAGNEAEIWKHGKDLERDGPKATQTVHAISFVYV